jgi:endonuclease YncB( thermonuclease family)
MVIALALLFATAPGQMFACPVVGVHDGDTMRCADGTRIRLRGIDANELDGSCHTSCAALSAQASQSNLEHLALNRQATCVSTGRSYDRVTAWCSVGPVDLSCAQVSVGAAIVWSKFDPEGRLLPCQLSWERTEAGSKRPGRRH